MLSTNPLLQRRGFFAYLPGICSPLFANKIAGYGYHGKKVYRKKDILVTKKKLNSLLLKYQKLIA